MHINLVYTDMTTIKYKYSSKWVPHTILHMRICRKVRHFPGRGFLECHGPLFVQLLASGKTAQNLKQTRLECQRKKYANLFAWFFLNISHLVFLFLCSAQFYACWILQSRSIRRKLNIPVKPLSLSLHVYEFSWKATGH